MTKLNSIQNRISYHYPVWRKLWRQNLTVRINTKQFFIIFPRTSTITNHYPPRHGPLWSHRDNCWPSLQHFQTADHTKHNRNESVANKRRSELSSQIKWTRRVRKNYRRGGLRRRWSKNIWRLRRLRLRSSLDNSARTTAPLAAELQDVRPILDILCDTWLSHRFAAFEASRYAFALWSRRSDDSETNMLLKIYQNVLIFKVIPNNIIILFQIWL